MSDGRIIAFGGSAGSIETLRRVLPGFPRDFQTPILVVVHISADENSILANVLDSAAQVTVATASDGMAAQGGCVYVAPPDRHLLVDAPGRIRVLDGPRENRHRPAVDPMFRSLARVYGPAAIGVVLSGGLDDGAAGLSLLRRSGGDAVVQDPEDAGVRSMPEAALRMVPEAIRVPSERMAEQLIGLARQSRTTRTPPSEAEPARERDFVDMWELETRDGSPSRFTCPECSGTLFEIDEGGRPRYRCRTGHGYSFEALSSDQTHNLERILWSAARALQERSDFYHRMAERFGGRGNGAMAKRAREQGEQDATDAEEVRKILFRNRA
jgi:two-component system chemotaxis response regulator CheB